MDKADLLSRTCGFIGLFAAFIAFYFMLPYFYTPKISTPYYTEITFNITNEHHDTPSTLSPPQQNTLIRPRPSKSSPMTEKKAVPAQAQSTPLSEKRVTKSEAATENTKKTSVAKKSVSNLKDQTHKNPVFVKNSDLISNNTDNKSPSSSTLNDIKRQDLQKQFINLVRNQLQNSISYPKIAKRRNLEGTVFISFSVRNGKITSYKLSASSGHKILDEAALKLAKGLLNLNMPEPLDFNLNVPIKYELH